jgi:hypothetical protein
MNDGPMEHATAFGIVTFLTLVLWFCFGYFREQFCIIMCPYGRLQSALTDDDTINVGYDENTRRTARCEGQGGGRLHRLPPLRAGLPDRHRHPQRPAARVHRLHRLHRCLR